MKGPLVQQVQVLPCPDTRSKRIRAIAEQQLILRTTAKHPRDHLIISLALGTGLRLGEIVGLNVGDVYRPDGAPRVRVRIRREIAKNGRAGDVFLPDKLLVKLRRLRRFKKQRGEEGESGSPLCSSLTSRRC